MTPKQDGTAARLTRVEQDVAEIKAAVLSIQGSVTQIQLGMQELYVSRREFTTFAGDAEHNRAEMAQQLERQVEREARRIDALSTAERARVDERLNRLERLTNQIIFVTLGALVTALVSLARAVIGG